MTRPTIPFDVSYTIRDGLRAEANDPAAMAAAVDWLQEQAGSATTVDDQTWFLGHAGACAGTLHQLDLAESLLREGMLLADAHGLERRSHVLRIRLIDVLALGGDAEAAIHLASSVLDDPEGLPLDLEDFVHQHVAKALLEAGRREEAIWHLERALALRQDKDDAELVASTLATLEAARHALGRRSVDPEP